MCPCMFPSATMVYNQPLSCNKGNFNTRKQRVINFSGINGYPNDIPSDIRDKLPKFSGIKSESTRKHLQESNNLIDDYEVDHEDMIMRLFV